MADVELLPLPEMGHFEQRYAGIPYQVRTAYTADQMHAYARANMEPLLAEVAGLRQALTDALDDIAAVERLAADSNARAERLAEALRDARRALAFAAQHLPECNEPYERANAALQDQEDRNG